MSLKKIIGQLILTDISSPDIKKSEKEYEKLLVDYNVGGIMLFNELNLSNFPIKIENQLEDETQAKELIKTLKEYSPKMFMAVDVEGGLVDRMHHIRGRRFWSPKHIGEFKKEHKDSKRIYNHFRFQGEYLKRIGFNMDAAPCLDTVSSYNDKYVMAKQMRSFSDNSKIVSSAAIDCINGFKDSKIIPIGKHFPGIGQVKMGHDPHFDFPRIKKITNKSLNPFLDAVDAGLEVVMSTHLVVENFGEEITTVNKYVLDILKLYDYRGLLMTDDICFMSTGMLNKNRERGPTKENIKNIVDTAYDSFKAGHDIILVRQLGCVNNEDTDFIGMIIDKIEKGVESKDIQEYRIFESYNKIQKLKEEYV